MAYNFFISLIMSFAFFSLEVLQIISWISISCPSSIKKTFRQLEFQLSMKSNFYQLVTGPLMITMGSQTWTCLPSKFLMSQYQAGQPSLDSSSKKAEFQDRNFCRLCSAFLHQLLQNHINFIFWGNFDEPLAVTSQIFYYFFSITFQSFSCLFQMAFICCDFPTADVYFQSRFTFIQKIYDVLLNSWSISNIFYTIYQSQVNAPSTILFSGGVLIMKSALQGLPQYTKYFEYTLLSWPNTLQQSLICTLLHITSIFNELSSSVSNISNISSGRFREMKL